MNATRFLRHIFATRLALRAAFNDRVLAAIEQAVRASEHHHRGEIRFVVEGALDTPALWHGVTPRARAERVFAELEVWNTEHNNGVLIYVLFADRAVEIVADRGFAGRVNAGEWHSVCVAMQAEFRHGRYLEGAVTGVQSVGRFLMRHFPAAAAATADDRNELPDRPTLL
jgi:uncharacterized membrane protein